MHPYVSNVDSKYAYAFLNGFEIFKINDSNNLAGPNPDPVQTPQNNILDKNGITSIGTTTISVVARVLSNSFDPAIHFPCVFTLQENHLYLVQGL